MRVETAKNACPLAFGGLMARLKATGWAARAALKFPHDSQRYRKQDLQPQLAAGSDHPQPARYRFLQAVDAATDPGLLSGSARDLFRDQPLPPCAAGRRHR